MQVMLKNNWSKSVCRKRERIGEESCDKQTTTKGNKQQQQLQM